MMTLQCSLSRTRVSQVYSLEFQLVVKQYVASHRRVLHSARITWAQGLLLVPAREVRLGETHVPTREDEPCATYAPGQDRSGRESLRRS